SCTTPCESGPFATTSPQNTRVSVAEYAASCSSSSSSPRQPCTSPTMSVLILRHLYTPLAFGVSTVRCAPAMDKLLAAVLVVAIPAFAGGKDFKDGLSKDEVTQLTKSLGALEAKYNDAKPSMEKLKKNPDVRRSAKLTASASEVLQHYTAVGVFLKEMEQG